MLCSALLQAALLLAPAAAPVPAQAPTADEQAQAQFERAEELVRAGRYKEARALYKRLEREAPETTAGIEAARRAAPSAFLGWADVVRHGPSRNRVDIVVMGDGYEFDHLRSFDKLSEDIPPLFERQRTLREYYPYFNLLRAVLVSRDSGVDGFGREYDTALNGHTTGTFAGHVGIDRALVMAALARIPGSDSQAIVFVKNGVLGTGGSGIATIGGRDVRTVIHEFGHSFGGLGDEYETQQSHAQGATVSDGINVAASGDPARAPWKHWIEAGHPAVGMHEGASGRVRGAWRPTASGCVMSSDEVFCVVCQEALVLRIYSIVDPIDSCSPEPQPQWARESHPVPESGFEVTVEVLRPATHALELSWWLLPEARLPRSGAGRSTRDFSGLAGPADRTRRGPLPPLPDAPFRVVRGNNSSTHRLRLTRNDLAPGRWRVVCRVTDTTQLRGEKWPWVLSDPLGLLSSERAWWVEVPAAR